MPDACQQHGFEALERLRARLGRRWLARVGAAFIAGAGFGGAAGVALFGWSGALVSGATVGALIVGGLGVYGYIRRHPRPTREDAALCVEARGKGEGAAPLLLRPGASGAVARTGIATIKRAERSLWPPAITPGLAGWCAGGIAALMLAFFLFPASGLYKALVSPPEEVETNHRPVGVEAAGNTHRMSDRRPTPLFPAVDGRMLADLRDALLSGSASERAAAIERYRRLWNERADAAAGLEQAVAAELRAGDNASAAEMQASAAALESALAAGLFAAAGDEAPDLSADSADERRSALLNLSETARRAEADAARALDALNDVPPDSEPAAVWLDRAMRASSGETLKPGSLSEAQEGVVVIPRDVWKDHRPAAAGQARRLAPEAAAIYERYLRELEREDASPRKPAE